MQSPDIAEIGFYRSISCQDREKNLLPKANTLPIPEQTSSNAAGTGTGMTGVPLPPLKPKLPKSERPLPKSWRVLLLEILLVSIVTAPFSAMALPHRMSAVVSG